jgi:small subunit ribosomal protein S1
MMDLLEQSEAQRSFQRGDVVVGSVAMVGEHEILIDVGAKCEGVLTPREFDAMTAAERRSLQVGDEVEVLVVNPHDRDGNLVLSMSQARLGQDWDDGEKLFEDGEVFEATVSGHNKGGIIVYVGKVRGFVPASQIDRRHGVDRTKIDGTSTSPLAALVGQPLWVKIIEIDRRKNRLILSEQAAMRERRKQSKAELLDNLEEGQVLSGTVTSLADFGAFVDVGGADGLVHLSELSWNRVNHPREILQLGETVTVRVISIDRERRRIGLSLKQLQPEPWSDLAARYEIGSVVPATVTRLTDYGAFARLDENIEGLVHVSELSEDGRAAADVVAVGDLLDLRVIRVDPDRKRIGLSLRRAGAEFDGVAGEEADDATLDYEDPESSPEATPSSGQEAAPGEPAPED